MSDTNSNFLTFYTNFLPRDGFAKIVPGALFGAAGIHFCGQAENTLKIIETVGIVFVVIAAGIAWSLGYVVQEVAEISGILKHQTQKYETDKVRYKFRQAFYKIASTRERQQAERYAVIKEAKGHPSAATLIVILLFAVSGLLPVTTAQGGEDIVTIFQDSVLTEGVIWLIWPVAAIALWRSSVSHCKKQYRHMEEVFIEYFSQNELKAYLDLEKELQLVRKDEGFSIEKRSVSADTQPDDDEQAQAMGIFEQIKPVFREPLVHFLMIGAVVLLSMHGSQAHGLKLTGRFLLAQHRCKDYL